MKKITILLALIAIAAAPAARPAKLEFQSAAARAAVQRYESVTAKAKEAYDRAVSQARRTLAEELQAQIPIQTRLGDLDEAVRLRDAVLGLQDNAPIAAPASPQPRSLVQTLAGTRWTHRDGWTGTLDAQMGTQSSRHGETGTWSVLPDGVTVRISNSSASCRSTLYRLGPEGNTLVDAEGQVMFRRAGGR